MPQLVEISLYIVLLLALIVLPVSGAMYVLFKTLFRQIAESKSSHSKRPTTLNPTLKIILTIVGILYGLFLLSPFLVFIPVRLAGIRVAPPGWLVFVYVIVYIPYLGIVYGSCGMVSAVEFGGSATKTLRHILSETSETAEGRKDNTEQERTH